MEHVDNIVKKDKNGLLQMDNTLKPKKFADFLNAPMKLERISKLGKDKSLPKEKISNFDRLNESWISGINLNGVDTDAEDGMIAGWDADIGEMVALGGKLMPVSEYKQQTGKEPINPDTQTQVQSQGHTQTQSVNEGWKDWAVGGALLLSTLFPGMVKHASAVDIGDGGGKGEMTKEYIDSYHLNTAIKTLRNQGWYAESNVNDIFTQFDVTSGIKWKIVNYSLPVNTPSNRDRTVDEAFDNLNGIITSILDAEQSRLSSSIQNPIRYIIYKHITDADGKVIRIEGMGFLQATPGKNTYNATAQFGGQTAQTVAHGAQMSGQISQDVSAINTQGQEEPQSVEDLYSLDDFDEEEEYRPYMKHAKRLKMDSKMKRTTPSSVYESYLNWDDETLNQFYQDNNLDEGFKSMAVGVGLTLLSLLPGVMKANTTDNASGDDKPVASAESNKPISGIALENILNKLHDEGWMTDPNSENIFDYVSDFEKNKIPGQWMVVNASGDVEQVVLRKTYKLINELSADVNGKETKFFMTKTNPDGSVEAIGILRIDMTNTYDATAQFGGQTAQ